MRKPFHLMEAILCEYNLVVISILSSASVVEQLEFGDFFSESVTKRRLFASVHDAVLYCLNHRGATSFPRYELSAVSIDG